MARLSIHFRSAPNLMNHGPGEVVEILDDASTPAISHRIDYLPATIEGPVAAWRFLGKQQFYPEEDRYDSTEQSERRAVYLASVGRLELAGYPSEEAAAKAKALLGFTDDFSDDKIRRVYRVRRYYFDLSKFPSAVRDNVAARLPLLTARNAADRARKAGLHALDLATSTTERDAIWSSGFDFDGKSYAGLSSILSTYYSAVEDLGALEISPVEIPATVTEIRDPETDELLGYDATSPWLIDRGEVPP